MILRKKQEWEQRASDHGEDPTKSWPTHLEAPEEQVPVREVTHWTEMDRPWYSDVAPSLSGVAWKNQHSGPCQEAGAGPKGTHTWKLSANWVQGKFFLPGSFEQHIHDGCRLQKVKRNLVL